MSVTSNYTIKLGPIGSGAAVVGVGIAQPASVPIIPSSLTTASPSIPTSIIKDKGDIVVGLANNFASRLPVGQDGYALICDSTQPLGIRYGQISGGGIWGTISGTLSSQTDLQAALNAKEPSISAGTSGQYLAGDKTWKSTAAFQPSGSYEPSISLGTSGQFLRGDKVWSTIPSTSIDSSGAASQYVMTADGSGSVYWSAQTGGVSGSYIPMSYLDTDTTLTANSSALVATQHATKTYADTKVNKSGDGAMTGSFIIKNQDNYGPLNMYLAVASGGIGSVFGFRTFVSRGTLASPTAVQTGDKIGAFSAFGYGSSFIGTADATLTYYANENFSSSGHGTFLGFELTPNGATTRSTYLKLDSTALTLSDAVNLVVGTGTGTKIGTSSTQKLGFFGATPIVRPSAYTQTYSTASKTNPASTYVAPIGGPVIDPNCRTSLAQLAADVDALKQLVNALIDDLQALGLGS